MSILSNLAFLTKFRLAGGAAAVTLLLSLGYSEEAEWLTPDPTLANPTALLAIAGAPPPLPNGALPNLPELPYRAVNDRNQVSFRGSFPLTRVTFNLPDAGAALPGGGLNTASAQFSRGGTSRQGIALGYGGPVPQGGFGGNGSGQSAPSVPEPPTWILIGVGGLMASFFARMKRKAALVG